MKTAIYPGSFNPWHEGHQEVLNKALCVFDKVIVAVGINPEKKVTEQFSNVLSLQETLAYGIKNGCIEVGSFSCLLADYVQTLNTNERKVHAVIRGLRNASDFEFERAQQYWNEDLKIGIPTYYAISGRNLTHVSSSALRQVEAMRGKK